MQDTENQVSQIKDPIKERQEEERNTIPQNFHYVTERNHVFELRQINTNRIWPKSLSISLTLDAQNLIISSIPCSLDIQSCKEFTATSYKRSDGPSCSIIIYVFEKIQVIFYSVSVTIQFIVNTHFQIHILIYHYRFITYSKILSKLLQSLVLNTKYFHTTCVIYQLQNYYCKIVCSCKYI